MVGKPTSVNQWPHVYREGTGRVVVTLHGYGGNEQEVSGLAQWLAPGQPVLSPRGTLSNAGMSFWYGRFTGDGFDPVDIAERADELMAFLRSSAEHYSFELPEALISGFSNGAAMAIALAVFFPQEIKQVAAFSGVFPFTTHPDTQLNGVSVWASHGDADMWVSRSAGAHVTTSLTDLGATVGSMVRPGGHGITDEEIVAARTFFGLS